MKRFRRIFLALLLVALYLVVAKGSFVSSCESGGSNRRKLREVVEYFNDEVERSYVGQFRGVREVRKEIEDKISQMNTDDEELTSSYPPLLLHLVGPSGTGKSFLAEIVAKAFFRPENCKSALNMIGKHFHAASTAGSAMLFAAQVGIVANPLAAAAAAAGGASVGLLGSLGVDTAFKSFCNPVESWVLSCGVVQASFSDASEDVNSGILRDALKRLAVELMFESNSVLVLDDFNFCVGKCQSGLKELLTQHTLDAVNGNKVSARNAIVILTSDLTHFGLEIRRGESYEASLERVDQSAKDFWGHGSFISTAGRIIPFAPLTDAEIVKVVDKMLNLVEREIRFKLTASMKQKEEEDEDYKYRWSGRFVCSERTKMQIIDHLHFAIEKTNSRAIVEQLSTILRNVIKHPVPVTKRLLDLKPKMGIIRDDKEILGVSLPMLSSKKKAYFFDQDITLVFNEEDPNRFVKLMIDGEEEKP